MGRAQLLVKAELPTVDPRGDKGDDEITKHEVTVLLADFATVWNELFPAEQARVQLLVERVGVHEDALEVRIRVQGLASLVGELRQQGERPARAA